jgi:hypothetical protein
MDWFHELYYAGNSSDKLSISLIQKRQLGYWPP